MLADVGSLSQCAKPESRSRSAALKWGIGAELESYAVIPAIESLSLAVAARDGGTICQNRAIGMMIGGGDPFSSETLGVLAHELVQPLARMGSEADLLALETLKELENAYGPGPQYERAKKKIVVRRENLREAHRTAVSTLDVVRGLREPLDRITRPDFCLTSLSALIERSIDRVARLGSRVRIIPPNTRVDAVCDKDLIGIALINVLSFGVKHSRSQVKMRVRLMRAGDEVVIALPFQVPMGEQFDGDNLGLLIAQRILRLHSGTLTSRRSGRNETQLRWPAVLPAAAPAQLPRSAPKSS